MMNIRSFSSALVAASLALAPAAQAAPSADLVSAWRVQAGDLHERLGALQGTRIPDIMRLEISRFGRVAGRLAKSGHVGATPLPDDLTCIFRGMAEEADVQLDAIADARTMRDMHEAKGRLMLMLEDASIVGEAAERVQAQDKPMAISGLRTIAPAGECAAPHLPS